MAFSKSARPRRAGLYVNWETTEQEQIPLAQGSLVALPLVHSWGPVEEAVVVPTYQRWVARFGNYATAGRAAAQQAFRGEGLPGTGGAGGVVAYRMGSASLATAFRVLDNTGGADALRVDARYPGTKGNDLRAVVEPNADATRDDFVVYDGALELERYVYPDADIDGLVAAVNGISRWVRLTRIVNGTALDAASSGALAGGHDGANVASGDWGDALGALETQRFGVFAPYNLTDDAIVSTIDQWAADINGAGRRFLTVLGGPGAETAADAVTDARAINNPDVVRLGVGGVLDTELGELSTAQLAPRLAGVYAARGESSSATFARLAGVEQIIDGATQAGIEAAYDGGVTVLSRDTYPAAPVRVEKSLTTYTTTNNPALPYSVFSNPKYVRTMHGIENDAADLGARPGIIGVLPVNDATRNFLKGELSALLRAREERAVVQPGWSVDVDQDPPPSDDDEFVAMRIGLKFGRPAEQVYLTIAAG